MTIACAKLALLGEKTFIDQVLLKLQRDWARVETDEAVSVKTAAKADIKR